jgi:hypothetical protein
MLILKKMSNLLFLFLFVITGIYAQLPQQQAQPTEVSNSEIKQFATALLKIQSIEEQIQGKMVSAVQDAGIDVQRFNEIIKTSKDPNQEVDASDDEYEKFNNANQAIEEIQNQAQQDMQKIVRENDLTVNRYQQIMMAVQNDPELQQKLQAEMEE